MEKIPILPITQKNLTFYLFSYDPRKVIKLVNISDKDKTQEHQRPWKESRVKDIAKYISGKCNLDFSKSREGKKARGILPNCPILHVKKKLDILEEDGQKFIFIPDSEEEVLRSKGDWEILDGQHRLISFEKSYSKKAGFNDTLYTMGYVLFHNLSIEEKKELFIVANVKQEKVEKNILRYLMRYLGILTNEEVETDELVQALNEDKSSPLAGRISVEGEKVKYGFKLIQVSNILQNSNTMATLGSRSFIKKKQALINYLSAWEKVYSKSFNNPKHTLGKVSGLRYIFYLFPFIVDILEKNKLTADIQNTCSVLAVFKERILSESFFSSDNEDQWLFRAETSTIALARRHAQTLKDIYVSKDEHFDPFA